MKEWMSLKTIAQTYADLSERKLREYLGHAEQPLPARLVGGKWLVYRADLDQWLKGFPRAGEDVDRLVDDIMEDMRSDKK